MTQPYAVEAIGSIDTALVSSSLFDRQTNTIYGVIKFFDKICIHDVIIKKW